jgi:hypothetical protein
MTHMGESKNTFKKIGPSLLLSRNIQRNTNQYDNNNQHIEYNHFIETAHFLQSCIEGIFGLTHIYIPGPAKANHLILPILCRQVDFRHF